MEVRFQPALHDLAQEGQQDLVWLEQQGIIIERDMLRSHWRSQASSASTRSSGRAAKGGYTCGTEQ